MNIFVLYFLFLTLSGTETNSLLIVNTLRQKGNDYIAAKAFDSASVCFAKITTDTTYANAVDFLQLASCNLHLKDTLAFKSNLVYSIAKGGTDSNLIHIYFSPNNDEDKGYLKQFMDTAFSKYRITFLSTIDTGIMREMNDILHFDQLGRTPEIVGSSNRPYINDILRISDSINYMRVSGLIKQGRYPGFHNFGIGASNYDQVLMHISDNSEERWAFIFGFLKEELRKGNITSKQVASIATRHYGNKQNCSYYGSKWRDVKELCNCKEVDKYRKEIGLSTLDEEYKRRKTTLPDCYKVN